MKLFNNKERKETTTPVQDIDAVRRTACDLLVKNADKHHGILEADLPIDFLAVEDGENGYQRDHTLPADEAIINKIAANWDWALCGTLSVSYRDGWFYVTDGWHRVLAAHKAGITDLPCRIYVGKSRSDEATQYRKQNNAPRKKMSAFDDFKAALVQTGSDADPVVFEILRVCESLPQKVLCTPGNEEGAARLSALKSAYNICKKHGPDALSWILKVIQDSGWHSSTRAYNQTIIKALRNIYLSNTDRLGVASREIVKVNQGTEPRQIKARAIDKFPHAKGDLQAMTKYWESILPERKTVTTRGATTPNIENTYTDVVVGNVSPAMAKR